MTVSPKQIHVTHVVIGRAQLCTTLLLSTKDANIVIAGLYIVMSYHSSHYSNFSNTVAGTYVLSLTERGCTNGIMLPFL